MWAHTMTVQDYQDLLDRGWRRSGKYVYKPTLGKTCCSQYTIRCHALNFQPSKSHKKILRKMSTFLSKGESSTSERGQHAVDAGCGESSAPEKEEGLVFMDVQTEEVPPDPSVSEASRNDSASVPCGRPPTSTPRPGVGADPSRPPCRKAKELAKERRLQKQQTTRELSDPLSRATILEDLISVEAPTDHHPLEVRLVRSSPPSAQFEASFAASYQVYRLYQMAVHKDPSEKPSESQFRTFLCDSPLEAERPPGGPDAGYGSFHQQYWLDGRIVAVGVIDVLPACVTSVYSYYHPEFARLSLGCYTALREISLTRRLHAQSPGLCYYYLGFYIRSCPKMRYKAQYLPADLLCPETFVWTPIERCVPRLEDSPYSRLNQDPDAGDARALSDVDRAAVLYERTVMPYGVYRCRRMSVDKTELQRYGGLVGQVCAERMLLYRS